MNHIMTLTLKGIIRDRVLHGILVVAVVFLGIPSVSSLSMRQVTGLATTLSLSVISFMLLLLSVFLGATAIWKDMERRYTISVLSLPLTRTQYLLGKYFALAVFIFMTAVMLGVIACGVVLVAANFYPPDRPILWESILACVIFDAMKYLLLCAFSFLFATVSTSFFLPVFGTLALFFVGNASQQVHDYVMTTAGAQLPDIVRVSAYGLYYILPNFTAFDFKVHAIYGLPLNYGGSSLVVGYFAVYTAIVLAVACIIFNKREIR